MRYPATQARGFLPRFLPARLLALFGLLLAGPPAAPAQQRVTMSPAPAELILPEGGARIPMQRYLAWAVVEVRINGHGPYRFVVDTGASGMFINRAVAPELELPEMSPGGPQVRVAGPGGGPGLPTTMHEIEELRIGDARLRDMRALVVELPFPRELAGVIGMSVFRETLLTFDYPAREIRVQRGELPPADGRTIFDMQVNDRGSHPRISVDLCGTPTEFTIDTGMVGWFRLPSEVATTCGLSHGPVDGPKARTVDAERATQVVRVTGALQIGAHRFQHPHGILTDHGHTPLIGGSALQDFVLSLDVTNRRLQLQRASADPITPPAMRSLGFSIRGTDDGPQIWGVLPESPAAKAGVRDGELAVELDGRPVNEWFEDLRLDQRLRQPDPIRLKLHAPGEPPREVTFEIAELLPAAG